MPLLEALPALLASRFLRPGGACYLQTLSRQSRRAGQVAGIVIDELRAYIQQRELADRLMFIAETAARGILPQTVVVVHEPLNELAARLEFIREAHEQGILPQEVEVHGDSTSESVSSFSGECWHQAEDSEVDNGVGG